jgi:hypothetical protein
MRDVARAVVAFALSVTSAGMLAQPKYAGPWDPVAVAAAERAVARLGNKANLEIRSTILTIPELFGR